MGLCQLVSLKITITNEMKEVSVAAGIKDPRHEEM